MSSKADNIAQAVADTLAAAGLPMTIEKRSGAAQINLDANPVTNCFVYPGTVSVTAQTRGWSSREVTVNVHLFRFLDEADENAQVDSLYELAESIENLLNNKSLIGYQFVEFASDSSARELLDPDTQTARYTFETQLEVTYYYASDTN